MISSFIHLVGAVERRALDPRYRWLAQLHPAVKVGTAGDRGATLPADARGRLRHGENAFCC
jgi:hypothetical protein